MRLNRREVLAGTLATLAAPALISRANAASGAINLGWIRQFATAGIVQKEAELAKAVGLTVNQVGFNRGLDGLIAMQKGDIDMTDTLIGYTQVCVALSQGIDVTLVSGTSLGLTEILIAPKLLPSGSHDEKNRAYTGANAWELLKGKSIGGARGSQQEYHLRAYLKENNIDFEKDIKFVDLKTNTDQVLALRQGSIDAACVIEPTAIQARMEGYAALLTFGYDKARVTALNAGVLVRTDFLFQDGGCTDHSHPAIALYLQTLGDRLVGHGDLPPFSLACFRCLRCRRLLRLLGPGGPDTGEFSSYCVDVFNGLSYSPDSFSVSAEPLSTALGAGSNAGRFLPLTAKSKSLIGKA